MKTGLVTRLAFGLLPLVASLAITSVLILAVGADPIAVAERVLEGAFRNSTAFSDVVSFWLPLVLCAMGLIITFTAGLWNIGVEGQMLMGAICASWAAQYVVLPGPLQIGVQLLLAVAGGAAWALVVGLLKTRFGVHEIFGGVGLNALTNVFAIYLISGPWQPPEGGSAQATAPFPREALLPPIATDFRANLLFILLAAAAIIGVLLLLSGTRLGLNLRATGKNVRSALLLGVPTTRTVLLALMLCGALAGLAGSYRVLFTYGSLRPFASGGIGFLALLVVLLVGTRPIFNAVVAFAFAAVFTGSTRLRVSLQLDSSLAGVLQGMVVLMALLANGLRQRLMSRQPVGDAPLPARTETERDLTTTAPTQAGD
jgi:simple sugar transport system permease protein